MKRWIMCCFLIVQVVHATLPKKLLDLIAQQVTKPAQEQVPTTIIKTEEQLHPVYALASHFAQGVAVTAGGPLLIVLLGLINQHDEHNVVKKEYAAAVIAVAGIPCLTSYLLQAANMSVTGFTEKKCQKCLQSVSRQEVLNHWAQVAGSGCAIASIYLLINMFAE